MRNPVLAHLTIIAHRAQRRRRGQRGRPPCYGGPVILAAVALLITAANVAWYSTFTAATSDGTLWLAIFNQLVAGVLAVIGFLTFSGRKTRPNPQIGRPRIWTLRRAFTYVALLASLGAVLLPAARFIGW